MGYLGKRWGLLRRGDSLEHVFILFPDRSFLFLASLRQSASSVTFSCHSDVLPQDQPPIDHGKRASLPLIQASETMNQSNSSKLFLSGIFFRDKTLTHTTEETGTL